MAFKHKYGEKKTGGIYIFLGIMSLLFFLLSSSVMPFLAGEGGSLPAGDLLLCFVCCIPAFAPKKQAVIFALALGLLSDLFINAPTSFSPVVFLVSVIAVGYFYGFFSRIGSLVMAVCSLPCLMLRAVVDTFAAMSRFEGSTAFGVLSKVALPSLLMNFALAIAVAFILRTLVKKLGISY